MSYGHIFMNVFWKIIFHSDYSHHMANGHLLASLLKIVTLNSKQLQCDFREYSRKIISCSSHGQLISCTEYRYIDELYLAKCEVVWL